MNSVVYRSIKVISKRDRYRIFAVVALQISFGLLDLLGVAVIGVLGALAITGVGSGEKGDRVNSVLEFLRLTEQSFQFQVGALGVLAALLLVSRTIFSVIFTKRMLLFLSNRAAVISSDLVGRILNQTIVELRKKTPQEIVYSITSGVNSITLGVIGVSVNLVSDISLLLILGIGLFVVNPTVAFSTLFIFSSIAIILYRISHKSAQKLGEKNVLLSIKSNDYLLDALDAYRELYVRNRRSYYAEKVGSVRFQLSRISAELSFMPYVSKYVIETSMVLGALLISAIQFKLQNAVYAVATLSVFLAAGTRIVPAILRVQQGALSIKSSLGAARPTLDYIKELDVITPSIISIKDPMFEHSGFLGEVQLSEVSFTYPGNSQKTISSVSLQIRPGQMIALVGPSGSGKSTIIDLILGILQPSEGKVSISGLQPEEAIAIWPGAIGYVPQNVAIINGTVRSNVALGFPDTIKFDEYVIRATEIARMGNVLSKLPADLDSEVGEKGFNLSGGERQRLGIARALFTQPQILVLDEATSSLDAETEFEIANSISDLKGSITLIVVAHRLSTIKQADVIFYVQNGQITHHGSFEELRSLSLDFDNQARLSGL
jgi:ABC-type multidrug transport system fused ATPase/permease subunit